MELMPTRFRGIPKRHSEIYFTVSIIRYRKFKTFIHLFIHYYHGPDSFDFSWLE